MRRVFVDTSVLVAWLVPDDGWHGRARDLFSQADEEGWHLVTTNAVVYETHGTTLIRARDKRRATVAFLDLVENWGVSVERIREVDETRAQAILRTHRDKTYSYCDSLSFAVMERLGIREAMSFDRHFHDYGRVALL